jgi:6-phosphogluconolactonase
MLHKLFFLFSLLSFTLYSAETYVYVATSDPAALETYKLNPSSNKLVHLNTLALEESPDTLAFSKDERFLYVSLNKKKPKKVKKKKGQKATPAPKSKHPESIKGFIVSLEIGKNGIPVKKHSIASEIQPRFMTPDATGKHLLVTDYFAGKSAIFELKNGTVTGKITSVVETEKFSHSIAISKDNKYAFTPHTAPNKVYQFKFDAKSGKLTNAGSADGPEINDNHYNAPRHCEWHPTLPILYTSNEHSGGISSWKMSHDGSLKLLQTLSSLPKDFQGKSTAADVHITADGRFAYVSNRGKGDATSKYGVNTLACFAIDPTSGKMTIAGHFQTAARPRSFCITPSGKNIIAIGQADKTVALHILNSKSGALKIVDKQEVAGKPNWALSLSK